MSTGCLTQVGQCHTSQFTQSNKRYLRNKKFLSVEFIQKSQSSFYLLLYAIMSSIHAGAFGSVLNLFPLSQQTHSLSELTISHLQGQKALGERRELNPVPPALH